MADDTDLLGIPLELIKDTGLVPDVGRVQNGAVISGGFPTGAAAMWRRGQKMSTLMPGFDESVKETYTPNVELGADSFRQVCETVDTLYTFLVSNYSDQSFTEPRGALDTFQKRNQTIFNWEAFCNSQGVPWRSFSSDEPDLKWEAIKLINRNKQEKVYVTLVSERALDPTNPNASKTKIDAIYVYLSCESIDSSPDNQDLDLNDPSESGPQWQSKLSECCRNVCSDGVDNSSARFYNGKRDGGKWRCTSWEWRYWWSLKLTNRKTRGAAALTVNNEFCYNMAVDVTRVEKDDGKPDLEMWKASLCFQPRLLNCVKNNIIVPPETPAVCFPSGTEALASDELPLCNTFISRLPEESKESYFRNTCRVNYAGDDLTACKCTNADELDEFNALQQLTVFEQAEKGCYWKYCQVNSGWVFPLKDDKPDACGGNYCVNAVDLNNANLTESQINNLQQNLTCFEDKITAIPETDTVDAFAAGGSPISGGNSFTNFIENNPALTAVFGVLIVLLLVLMGGIGYLIFKINRNKDGDKDEKKVETKPASKDSKEKPGVFDKVFTAGKEKPPPKAGEESFFDKIFTAGASKDAGKGAKAASKPAASKPSASKPAAKASSKPAKEGGFFDKLFTAGPSKDAGKGAKAASKPAASKPSSAKPAAKTSDKPAPKASKAEVAKNARERRDLIEKLKRVGIILIPAFILAGISFGLYVAFLQDDDEVVAGTVLGRRIGSSEECTVLNAPPLTVSTEDGKELENLLLEYGMVSDLNGSAPDLNTPMVFRLPPLYSSDESLQELYQRIQAIRGKEIYVTVDRDVATLNNATPEPNIKLTVYGENPDNRLGNIIDNYTDLNPNQTAAVRKVIQTLGPESKLINRECDPEGMPQRNSFCTAVAAFVVPESVDCNGCSRDGGGFSSTATLAVPGDPPTQTSLCKEICIRAGPGCSGFNVDPDTGTCSFFSGTPTEDYSKDADDNPLSYCYLKI